MGGDATFSVLAIVSLSTITTTLVSCYDEIHSDEGGRFIEYRNQTDFAEAELRKHLDLTPQDKVHLHSVAIQIEDSHTYNTTFYVKRTMICSMIVHDRSDDMSIEIVAVHGKAYQCVQQPLSTTEADTE